MGAPTWKLVPHRPTSTCYMWAATRGTSVQLRMQHTHAACSINIHKHRRCPPVLQGMKWQVAARVYPGWASSTPLADTALKQALALKRWHHLLVSATQPALCALHINGELVAQQNNCSLATLFTYCLPGSNLSLAVGGFQG